MKPSLFNFFYPDRPLGKIEWQKQVSTQLPLAELLPAFSLPPVFAEALAKGAGRPLDCEPIYAARDSAWTTRLPDLCTSLLQP